MRKIEPFVHLFRTSVTLWADVLRLVGASFRSRTALAAKNFFLRKQLALYRGRRVRPRRASEATRLALVLRAPCFAQRDALVIVKRDPAVSLLSR